MCLQSVPVRGQSETRKYPHLKKQKALYCKRSLWKTYRQTEREPATGKSGGRNDCEVSTRTCLLQILILESTSGRISLKRMTFFPHNLPFFSLSLLIV